MKIWPVKWQLYAVMVFIKSKSVVEVQRRFRHEFIWKVCRNTIL